MATPLTEEGLERILMRTNRMSPAGGTAAGMSSSILEELKKTNLTPAAQLFVDTAGGMTNALSKLITGNANLTSAFEVTRSLLNRLGLPGQLFADTVLRLVETGNELNNALKKTSQSGMYFGNNLAAFSEAVNFSRLGLEGFTQVLSANSRQLSILRDREFDAGQKFAGVLNNMALSKAGEELIKTTGSAEILSDSFISVVSGLKFVKPSAESLGNLQFRATELSVEMDNLSRLTGVSSKQLNQQLQERSREAQNTAYMRTLDEAGQKRYQESLNRAFAIGGPTMQKLFEQLQQFGNATTEDTARLLATLGPAQGAIIEYARASKTGQNVQESYNNALAAMSTRMNDPAYLNLVMLGGTGTLKNALGEQAVLLEKNNLLMPAMLKAQEAYKEYLKTDAQGGKSLQDFIVEEMNSAIEARKKTLSDPNANLSLAYNSANEMVQRAAAGTSTMFTILNEQMMKNSKLMSYMNEGLDMLNPDKVKQIYDEYMNMFNTSKGVTADQIKEMKNKGIPVPPGFDSSAGAVTDYNKPNISTTQINASSDKDKILEKLLESAKISSATPPPSGGSGIQTVSKEEQNSILNEIRSLYGQINNNLGRMIDLGDQQLKQLKSVVNGVSNNRGAK